ncbi:MAG: hypothetical protein ACLU0O_06320 [Collinsella sp.]
MIIAYAYSGSSRRPHRHEPQVRLLGEIRADRQDLRQDEGRRRQDLRRVRAFCVRTGGGSQTLVSFSWSAGGVKVAKEDSEAGSEPQGDASLDGASFSVVNGPAGTCWSGAITPTEACATIKTAPKVGSRRRDRADTSAGSTASSSPARPKATTPATPPSRSL